MPEDHDHFSDSEDGHIENPVATFQTLSAEGDLLLQKGSFHEAIEVYTRALALRPQDKHCLVCRSRCYIQIGSPRLALGDADASLSDDPTYFKGLYLKAEALYAQGDFELALMYYHRGNKLRPELNEFRTGIQKAREAIDNSIGDPKAMKIRVPQKLRRNLAVIAASQPSASSGGSSGGPAGGAGSGGGGAGGVGGVGAGASGSGAGAQAGSGAMANQSQSDPRPYYLAGNLTPMMESKLLGELYDDKVYLQELLNDRDFVEYPDEHVLTLINDGLRYLSTRVEFWRQQHPLYARKPERKIHPRMERRHLPAFSHGKPQKLMPIQHAPPAQPPARPHHPQLNPVKPPATGKAHPKLAKEIRPSQTQMPARVSAGAGGA
ncbi:hypothetical protein HK105_200957 [Polyrhizophydium stewartii]|uniref:Outer dynein arm-docking complex subunit 4 n=1 Tax=Polyrhizophydium stewartii TaxID=2732419 RepID=A0ABR4NIF3_9FUNG|nr:Tetratricopeptide repeat protein 25 [Polyrhizophydium stewartii]